MDALKPTSATKKTKLARAIAKVINLQTATRNSKRYLPKQKSLDKAKDIDSVKSRRYDRDGDSKLRNRAAMEALVAKIFAGISSIKAAYAELQTAQFPYDSDAIQSADEAVVNELKGLSELKQSFLKKEVDHSPQVTLLLAEIQEQQALMKTYEITLSKMESEVQFKDNDIESLRNQLDGLLTANKAMEKKLNSSGSLSVPFNVKLSDLNPTHFVQALHYALRSMRSFVKLMITEMESARWDLAAAAHSIEPNANFVSPNHKCFAFESYVCRVMFDGFNDPNFSLPTQSLPQGKDHRRLRPR
ncbi:hypothetical protein L1049_009699 [Liquidambar formosana]|uniref:DUF641 domain-containing protein n=1 Tax=Liquidambar formosana TaxID=63359 RepID=A0AAP0N8G7_LIQFO